MSIEIEYHARAAKAKAPLLSITSPEEGFQTDKLSIRISAMVAYNGDIDRVVATNRTAEATVSVYDSRFSEGSFDMITTSEDVPLVIGANSIAVIATARDGKSSTKSIIINRTRPKERIWVLIIAIDLLEEEQSWPRRTESTRALAEAYTRSINNEIPISLLGNQATGRNIRKAPDSILIQSGPSDRVVLFFSGKVLVAEGGLFLIPGDGEEEFASTLIHAGDLGRTADRGAGLVGILDGCSGASIDPPPSFAAGRELNNFLVRITECGRPGSSAADVMVRAFDGGADTNADGSVTIGELAEFLKSQSNGMKWFDGTRRRDLSIWRSRAKTE
jgi:hypothetical protein